MPPLVWMRDSCSVAMAAGHVAPSALAGQAAKDVPLEGQLRGARTGGGGGREVPASAPLLGLVTAPLEREQEQELPDASGWTSTVSVLSKAMQDALQKVWHKFRSLEMERMHELRNTQGELLRLRTRLDDAELHLQRLGSVESPAVGLKSLERQVHGLQAVAPRFGAMEEQLRRCEATAQSTSACLASLEEQFRVLQTRNLRGLTQAQKWHDALDLRMSFWEDEVASVPLKMKDSLPAWGFIPGGFSNGDVVYADEEQPDSLAFWHQEHFNFLRSPLAVTGACSYEHVWVVCQARDIKFHVHWDKLTKRPPNTPWRSEPEGEPATAGP